MFTIEHEFDATIITLVDEGSPRLREDVIIRAREDRISIEQFQPETGRVARVILSPSQLADLAVALDLPEGVYQRVAGRDAD